VNDVWLAFGLTTLAGLATGIGSVIAFTVKTTNYRFLSVATGFSAGVMLYVSFVEILFKGADALTEVYGAPWGNWINTGGFFAGIALIALIDNLIPTAENPHEAPAQSSVAILQQPDALEAACAPPGTEGHVVSAPATARDDPNPKLMRTGLFTALAIGIHNFPEGLATFLATLYDPSLGVAVAIAVALHNIPEGIAVSVPIYYATGKRARAFSYSVLSGLAEPVGAAVGYVLLLVVVARGEPELPQEVLGIVFAAVAGIMVYISVDELLPTSREYGKGHDSILGLVTGMAVMAVSLLLFIQT
jgi:zinc transporter, ZIP family